MAGHREAPALGLQPGDRALEVGAGLGLYTLEAARSLGSRGQLVCMDVEAKALKATAERVHEAGLEADLLRAEALDLPIRSASLDHVFLVGSLAEASDRTGVLLEIRRVLCPDGRLSVAEPLLPSDSPEYEELRRDLLVAGFVRDKQSDRVTQASSWRRVD